MGIGETTTFVTSKATEAVLERAAPNQIAVALLTGGGDRPYAFGLGLELVSKRVALDVIGGDELDCSQFRDRPEVQFFNLRGDQRPDVSFLRKAFRICSYYIRLIHYAATAKPKIFHLLWNNKFESFDRTLLMLYYKILNKKIVLTVHNVNKCRRDSKDSLLNRLTLRVQYHLADHMFVHTERMKRELTEAFGVSRTSVTVVPFGINNAAPNTQLTSGEAREKLGIGASEKAILFFGNVAPYKGLEYLVDAFQLYLPAKTNYRLIIAGRPTNCEKYWTAILGKVREDVHKKRILLMQNYVPDNETELYFKAADLLVLPYRFIYQSGVLFLAYSFGLPVLAADVGCLRDEIVPGETGFVFRAEDARDLANNIQKYFAGPLFANLSTRRQQIRRYATQRHSWDVVGEMTVRVYRAIL